MPRRTSTLRLFAAIYPPEAVARAMLVELRRYELPEHREVSIEQIHLTMQFIGDTPGNKVDETIESVQRAAAGLAHFELKPVHYITLPDVGHARLVAVETDAPPAVLEIKRRLVTRLATNPREKKRTFRPHLTVCRFQNPIILAQPLREPVDDVPAFQVREIALMQSTLHPDGPVHKQVAVTELR